VLLVVTFNFISLFYEGFYPVYAVWLPYYRDSASVSYVSHLAVWYSDTFSLKVHTLPILHMQCNYIKYGTIPDKNCLCRPVLIKKTGSLYVRPNVTDCRLCKIKNFCLLRSVTYHIKPLKILQYNVYVYIIILNVIVSLHTQYEHLHHSV